MSDSESEEDLKRAIALSLQEAATTPPSKPDFIDLISSDDEDDDLEAPVFTKKNTKPSFPAASEAKPTAKAVLGPIWTDGASTNEDINQDDRITKSQADIVPIAANKSQKISKAGSVPIWIENFFSIEDESQADQTAKSQADDVLATDSAAMASTPSQTPGSSFLGLNRKQMEEERRQRLLQSSKVNQDVAPMDQARKRKLSASSSVSLPYFMSLSRNCSMYLTPSFVTLGFSACESQSLNYNAEPRRYEYTFRISSSRSI